MDAATGVDGRLTLTDGRTLARVVMADRPGFGASTRMPGRGLVSVADDLAELLNHLGLDRVPVIGVSGGGPHVLALGARHAARVSAATVVVGAELMRDLLARAEFG